MYIKDSSVTFIIKHKFFQLIISLHSHPEKIRFLIGIKFGTIKVQIAIKDEKQKLVAPRPSQ